MSILKKSLDKLIPHTARSFGDLEPVFKADDVKELVTSLRNERDAHAEHVERLLRERIERDALAAHVKRLCREMTGIINDSCGVAGYHLNGAVANWGEFESLSEALKQTPAQSLQLLTEQEREKIAHDAVSALKFPTMLRKMWSGGEIQQWLDEAAQQYAKRSKDGE